MCSEAIFESKAQPVEILLLVTSFHFFSLILFLFFYFYFILLCIHCCMSIWVRNERGRLEILETYFGNLFDTPLPSPSSSIMGDETRNNHEENRRIMYELLHPTQNSVPSCIMFPPNAPHVELKQGLLAILPDFRGQENENPYVHVRAFEEVISSFYAQNVI